MMRITNRDFTIENVYEPTTNVECLQKERQVITAIKSLVAELPDNWTFRLNCHLDLARFNSTLQLCIASDADSDMAGILFNMYFEADGCMRLPKATIVGFLKQTVICKDNCELVRTSKRLTQIKFDHFGARKTGSMGNGRAWTGVQFDAIKSNADKIIKILADANGDTTNENLKALRNKKLIEIGANKLRDDRDWIMMQINEILPKLFDDENRQLVEVESSNSKTCWLYYITNCSDPKLLADSYFRKQGMMAKWGSSIGKNPNMGTFAKDYGLNFYETFGYYYRAHFVLCFDLRTNQWAVSYSEHKELAKLFGQSFSEIYTADIDEVIKYIKAILTAESISYKTIVEMTERNKNKLNEYFKHEV